MGVDIQATDLDAAAKVATEAGKPVEALRQLIAANRLAPNSEREILIRDLRLNTNLYGPRTPASVGEAPTLSYEQEMPTCSMAEITSDLVRAAFAERGCIYIPGALDKGTADTLRTAIDNAQNAWPEEQPDPRWYSQPKMASREHAIQVAAARDFAHRSEGTLAADSPRAMFLICDMLERTGVSALAEKYLGEAPVMSADKFMLWRVGPGDSNGGWHQDGRFLGEGMKIASLNIWTALTDCGESAPGMDLVLDNFNHYIMAEQGSHFDWAVSDAQVDELRSRTPVVTPRFKAGDMLMFDHWFLHRTGRRPEMTDTRYAIESWFFAPSVFPVGRSAMIA
jgi:hypothetical protein